MMDWSGLEILIGGVATLAIYSFLWRENRFYRFFEHLFIGISVGLAIVETTKTWLWPKGLDPLIWAFARVFCRLRSISWSDDELPGPANLLLLAPMLFGLLYYTLFSRRRGWMARLVIGFSLGIGGGMAFKGFFAAYLPQIIKSFKPLWVLQSTAAGSPPVSGLGSVNWAASFENQMFLFVLACVMVYFFFSIRHDLPVIKQASVSGRWLIMVSFGAFFGATVMARMALLVERLQFLVEDFAPAVGSSFAGAADFYWRLLSGLLGGGGG